MASQAVLQNVDILSEIFEVLRCQWRGGRNALASCARCCRTWHEPAIDVLWRSVDRTESWLESLLPVQRTGQGAYLYAKLIRRLSCDDKIHPTITIYLIHLSSGEALFPSLRALSFTISDQSPHGTAPYMFISPALRELSLSHEHGSFRSGSLKEKRESLYRADSTFLPFLDALSVAQKGDGGLEVLRLLIDLNLALSCIGKFHHLRDLSLRTGNSFQFLSQLQYLKNLQSLTLNVGKELGLEEDVEEVAIPSLRALRLLGELSPSCATQILRLIVVPQLHSLCITSLGTVADCRACWVQVTSRFHHLRELMYEAWFTDLIDGSVLDLAPFFHSLPKMEHLNSLNFELRPEDENELAHSLTDDDCEAMASAFPNLRTLAITIWDEAHPSPTFRSLVAFARGFSTLEHLAIPIDASNLPPISEIPVLSHPLETLWFRSVKIVESAPRAAYLLKRLFPALKEFGNDFQTNPSSIEASWNLLDECLKEFENMQGLEQVRRDLAPGASARGSPSETISQ
ncbi:hypothetical protein JAAARDRAFT_38920 [Jaapia argillacea MUCL 33604]|uniref:F-box domain-containing protein n=1 Tax=Jaapia argillacea MUCL 33604 TaxID=933084 RepID=A0A067PJE7_9AGAM|nr:hypothetical protein JAAARDRAFT_38920 [Jaapia argillacea MUCL 33604]